MASSSSARSGVRELNAMMEQDIAATGDPALVQPAGRDPEPSRRLSLWSNLWSRALRLFIKIMPQSLQNMRGLQCASVDGLDDEGMTRLGVKISESCRHQGTGMA